MEIKDNNHEVKSDNEVSAVLRKYDNFDEQQFYNRYADEIEADLNRREQQSNNNNGTEENDSTREEQRHDRGNQVQSGQRTDDNSGSEGGEDSEGAVRTRDEGSDEQKSSSEESAVGGQREQETDIEQVEGANEVDKSSHKTDNQGNPLNADGTLKLEKVKSVDDLTDEDFSKPTRSVELPQVPENVDNALGADGKPVIIKKNIFEKNWEAHKFPFAESRSILKSALYNTDLVGQTQPTKRPLHWVAIKLDEKSPIVVLEVNENKDNVEIVGWYTLDGRNLERIKRQAEKNDGELVMLSPKDKVESLSTPQSDLSSDGKGKEKVSSKQGSVGRKNVYGKNKVADWRTSVSSAMRQYETSPHDAHVAMCDIIDGMDSNALYGLMRMVLRTITSLDNENIRDGWKVDATHDLFDILKDRGFVVTKGSKGVAIGDVVIDKHGIIYVVEGVGKSRLDCGLSDVNDKTIIDHMTISRASVKYYYRDVNGKKDSVRLQKADVVDAELMAEEKPFNAIIEMLRKKFPDASMEALTAADRLLREQALPGERQKAIEAVAKALGLKVEWRDTMEKENGTFNPKTRTITIARDSEHALANTFGHEVTHAVREISEADYKNLKDAVRRLYPSEKEYNEAVQAYGEVYTDLDFGALEEELIADNIGFMIGGRNDMTQELASRMNHRVLWAIHDAMNKVRNALAKVLHIDSKKNGLLEAIDSARATIRETMANAQRIAKEKGQGLSNESDSTKQSLRTQDTTIRDALVERMRLSGMDVITDETGQRVLDMANGEDIRAHAMLSSLVKATNVIRRWLADDKRGESFTIELPESTQRMIRMVMGRNFKNHKITANNIAHAYGNHGVGGKKITKKSIPLTKKNMELMPYIIVAPDYVRKGSVDKKGNESIRFYKTLSNGYVVVVEKEQIESPHGLESITMWAEQSSSNVADARHKTSPAIDVRSVIISTEDAAKIRKDAENAIAKDQNIREQRVYHGSGADFEAFDHSHMGEGQGTQSFGWGTYVTSSEGIGRTYSESARKKPTYLYGGKEMPSDEFHDYVLSTIVGYMNEDMLNDFMYNIERYGVTRAKDILKKGDLAQYKNLFYQSIGDTRNYAEWKIKAARTLLSLKGIRIRKPKIHLYTVEIPEDNGSNYLDWKAKVGVGLLNKVNSQLEQQGKSLINPELDKRYEFLSGGDLYRALSIKMAKDEATFIDNKAASEFLSSLGLVGIKYPAGTIHGGAKEGDTNYVIFNEKDAKITDHVRFFRTSNGEAYGFTVGGKIYIDPKIATSETPIHEYAHLWATALKSANAKEWQNVVGLMKGTKVWDEVKALYPELKSDDEIADEVLATYSGRRGAERLREEQRRIAKGNGSVFEKAEAISALERVKQALKRFWKGVADFLHIHYTSAEEVADRVMKDLLDGVDPRTFGDVEKGIRFQTSEELNNRFGSRWLDEQTNDDGRHTTQVKSTINSYKKFGDWVKRDSNGRDVDVLDASSGLGLGTAWMRDNGFKVDDVEPFPSDSREAPTFSSYDEIDKKYDYIISNAVLNVIPDDWRANVLHQMADKLKDGGKLVINVRGAKSISKQGKEGETRITLDSPSEILVLRPNGSIKAYQKGFTKSELKEWCEKELGEGYSVEIANNKNAGGSYDTAVVVTKNNESGTVGVASEAGHPSWSAQALPSSVAKLEKNQEYAKDLAKLSGTLSKKVMGAHEFLFSVAKAFGFEEGNFNKSFYKDLGSSVGIRISDHSANPDNIINRNDNSNVYGLVIKLSNHRFKSRKDANYLEYVYYPDKLTQERQQEIVGGLKNFLETGDYAQLPSPDRVNRSGVFATNDNSQTKPSAGPREAERMEIKQSLRDGTFIQSGSYFSGGGLLEEGLKNYLDPKVAVEFNSKISGVYADNHGRHIVTADVRDVDPAKLVGQLDSPVEYFHASPVCKNFSRAKRESGEVELDKETARSTADFIKANHPKVVTIENVKGYRDSEALKIITDELSRQGYDWDMDVYNAADFGGYTSRERLIVRAVRDGELPPKPKAIAKEDRKKGWMEAVSDLIPTLHEKRSGVPEWMDSRLKAEGIDWHNIDKPLYVFGQGNNKNSVPHTFADELLPTLRTKGGDVIIMPDGRVLRAEPRVLARVTGLSDDYHMPITDDLAHTIVGNGIPAQLSQGVIGPLLEGVFNGGERVTDDVKASKRGEERHAIVASAIEDGTYMKAPNGEDSNLDEENWVDVRTKEFKDWFGDWENDPEHASKVVDENGEPLVVYHDTNSTEFVNVETGEIWDDLGWREKEEWKNRDDFDDYWEERPFYTFDNKSHGRRSIEMPAFFFTPNYDEYHEYGERTIAAFLNIKNPIKNPEIPNSGATDTAGEDAMNHYIEQGYDGFIREYDGIVDEINAFFPNQIKSAEENNGDYSRSDNDIRHSLRGMPIKPNSAEVAKREAQTNPSAGPREAEPKTLKGKEALAALDNIFRENAASVMPETVSSLERFKDLFRRPIRTFLGELVKVKDEVWNKILRNNRQDITGTVLPTIENADFAIRDTDGSTLYVKRFESERSGNLYNIVVVNKHGEVEDYVSSVHIKRDGNLRNKIKNGAELFLPQERNTDGTLFRNNSTPAAKVVKTDGLSQQSNEKKQSRRGTPNLNPDHIAQAIYEQSVSGFKFDLDEAWHDSLLSVKRLQEAISETRGVPIRDFENVYWHAVTLSSVNAAEMEQLMNLRIQPFIEAVQDICKKHDLTQEDIEVYLNCKHGLERNEAMARRAAEKQANEEFKDELRKAERAAAKDPLDQDAADALDDVKQRMNDREEELYFENREKDYSGLTDIFDPKDKVTGDRLDLTVSKLEDKAKKFVDDFENKVGMAEVTKLWDNIHELNNYSLRKSYLSGLISKSQYDSVKQMYQWYVPLRGFNEEVAGDVYTYVTRGETRNQQHPKRKHPLLAKTRVNPLPNRRRIMP